MDIGVPIFNTGFALFTYTWMVVLTSRYDPEDVPTSSEVEQAMIDFSGSMSDEVMELATTLNTVFIDLTSGDHPIDTLTFTYPMV